MSARKGRAADKTQPPPPKADREPLLWEELLALSPEAQARVLAQDEAAR